MGNRLSNDDGWIDFDEDSESDFVVAVAEGSGFENMISGILGSIRSNKRKHTTMPVIRKKPDLSIFRHTSMYREIKARCGLPVNSRRPSDRWSLMRELLKRECGIGNFNYNQQRRITNYYIPNEKETRLMSLDNSKLFICSFTKDGSKLITASNDAIVRISDSSKGTYHLINRVKADQFNWGILDVDSSPCGQYFAYCSWTNSFFVAPIKGSEQECKYYDLNADNTRCAIFSVRFSPDGRSLLGGSNNSGIYFCDRETRAVKYIQTERCSEVDINAVSYVSDQDSNLFVTGCDIGLLKLWDTRCTSATRNSSSSSSSSARSSPYQHPVGVFMGHLDGITYIDPRNDGIYLLTNSKDQSCKIWDLRKTTPTNKFKQNNLPLLDWDYRYDLVPREYYNPTSPLDGDVSVMTYRGHRVTKSLLRAKFSPALQTGQRYIYTGCSTGRIIIYDVLTGSIAEAIEGHKDIVRDLCWHPTRAEIISSSWDSHVNLNVFKRNKLLKRTNTDNNYRPVRRSRRIATQNGTLEDDDDDDNESAQRW